MFFYWALLVVRLALQRPKGRFLFFNVVNVLGFGSLAAGVAFSRVYLGYHTTRQVLGGAGFGVCGGILWGLLHASLLHYFIALEGWWLSRLLHLKETGHLESPLEFEAEMARQARKQD
jgi:membrane-associated phospholipid phosphatase